MSLEWLAAAAVLILIAGYGIGAPLLLMRTAITVARRRRMRYRSSHDDVLASSRFTIPVSLILPVDEATSDLPSAILRLLELRYPELELIVVIENQPDALETLKMACDLTPVRAVLPPDAEDRAAAGNLPQRPRAATPGGGQGGGGNRRRAQLRREPGPLSLCLRRGRRSGVLGRWPPRSDAGGARGSGGRGRRNDLARGVAGAVGDDGADGKGADRT